MTCIAFAFITSPSLEMRNFAIALLNYRDYAIAIF
jgi:hypothetical protein